MARDLTPVTPGKYIADTLLTKPGVAQSAYDNFVQGATTSSAAQVAIGNQLSEKPEGEALLTARKILEFQNENPEMGYGQKGLNFVSNMIGQVYDPASLLFGGIGSVAGRTITAGAAAILPAAVSSAVKLPLSEIFGKIGQKYLPERIGKEGADEALSLSLIGKQGTHVFTSFAGVGVPQAVAENYNLDTNHISWGGVARSATEMGAYGLAFGSVPFAYGIIKGKMRRGLGEEAFSTPSAADSALEKGLISPDEHKWYVDYLEHQKAPADAEKATELQERATQLIGKNDHEVDTVNHEAPVSVVSADQMENLKAVLADQVASDLPAEYRTSMSDFVIHNEVDNLRDQTVSIDGLRGYSEVIEGKLKEKPRKIAEANKILDDHMLKSVKDNMPFSQKNVMKGIKQGGFEASHIQHIPLIIPENLIRRVKLLDKISKFKSKIKKYGANAQTERRIKELEDKLPKVLTPKEELVHLKEKLLTEKGLPKNWKNSEAYSRLQELAQVWHNARTLLDRVHLEHEYENQEAIKSMVDQLLNIVDGDLPRIAKRENVMEYLKQRIDNKIEKPASIEQLNTEVNKQLEVPQDASAILKNERESFEAKGKSDLYKEFEHSADLYEEFKASPNIFKTLISCVLGTLNG
jgi:hypothetical protein